MSLEQSIMSDLDHAELTLSSAIYPREHVAIGHPNASHYERPAASPFGGNAHSLLGFLGRGRMPAPPSFQGMPLLHRPIRK